MCGGLRHERLVRPPTNIGDHGGKNFYGKVVPLTRTGRLWVLGGMKEGEKTVRVKIKLEGGVIVHGVELARVIENWW